MRTRRLAFTLVTLGLTLGGLTLGASGCFIESAQPSTFRFQCSSDSECGVGEQCASGLCQQACGGEDDAECSQEAPVCLNGYCSSVCPTTEDVCPAPQECMSLAVPGEDPSDSGVCTIACSEQNPCPDGQVCFGDFGLCALVCATNEDCASGEECLANVCVPSDSGGGAP
ncbi:hypothetical protein ENSA5_12280 [Enhygromyxa salina]|uniref:Uncharacterized protein n=1 Tax=Enhygromyxa salina TaxID=215803 RepID=A0A2S9YFJ3_9BACT|nr:hypothetical protein [Enhygromyxa salina]PRQ03859.1 hypothetical protein ENSA5_12280 [Enhygromyxa salina]